MINRVWLRAFRQGNASLAKKVTAFMREEFGWEVLYSYDYGCITTVENGYGTWEEDFDDIDNMDASELLDSLRSVIHMGPSTIAKLDMKFNPKSESIGKYTKLPLPKDVKKEVANVTPV